jgi:hypothetical protein
MSTLASAIEGPSDNRGTPQRRPYQSRAFNFRPGKRGPLATGRSTRTVTFRLSFEDYQKLARRAEKADESVAAFVERVVRHELRDRPGEGTRKRARRQT